MGTNMNNNKKDNVKRPSKNHFPKGSNNKRSNGRNRSRNVDSDGSNSIRSKSCASSTNSMNDISWYTRNPELLAAAARVPFPYKPGMVFNPGTVTVNSNSYNLAAQLPGVCILRYAYSIGFSDNVTSPASIAAREMYGRIRSKFSGSLEADAPDIFMYCIAIDQVHSYIAWLKRLYRILNTYSPQNRDYPEILLQGIGYSPADVATLQQDRVKLWGYINTLINMINKFTVPDDMDIYHRHRWMNEHVYTDEPMAASQSYMFHPTGFYVVDTTGSTGTALKYTQFAAGTDTADELYQFGKTMIDALSNWEDAYTINGYMLRAYEGTQFYTCALLLQDEVVTPVYEPEVLSQIENFTGLGTVSSLDITQDPNTNVILHKPTAVQTWTADNIINLHTVDPTAADVTVASRLTAYVDSSGFVHAGTEIPISMSITTWTNPNVESGTSAEYQIITYIQEFDVASTSVGDFAAFFTPIAAKCSFNHAPMCWVVANSTSPAFTTQMLFGDVCNITAITNEQLEEITRVCIYSEFNCFR